ncbi:MAG: DNA polymerase I [Actinobacteria bacterium]|nr:DNA polymerase I [Actinomycetota bacterium]
MTDLNCTKCNLHLNRTHVVSGEGPVAEGTLVFVGEAPGRVEDETGRPFSNEDGAGRILSGLLSRAGLKRKEVYITNIVKCRPPNNRAPEAEEIAACLPYLKEELKAIKPKCVVALGAVASIPLTGMSLHNRGLIAKLLDYYELDCPVLITYHPAYLMRARDMYPVVVHDISKLLELESYMLEPEEDYIFSPSPERLAEELARAKDEWTAVDIETVAGVANTEEDKEGLNPFTDEIVGIAFSYADGKAISLSGPSLNASWPLLKPFLEEHKKLVYQNNLFDRCFFTLKGIDSKVAWDTYSGMAFIHSDLPRKLDFLRSLYTNKLPYKTKENYRFKLNWVNCSDVDVTRRVALKQMEHVNVPLMKRYLKHDDIAIKMRVRGVLIDQNALARHYAELLPQTKAFVQKFAREYNIMISSPKQLSNFIFKELKLPDPSRKGSTKEDNLMKIKDYVIGDLPELKILDEILEYRGLDKLKSTYCEGIFKRIQADGRVHPDWRTLGTDTGRWSARDPNLQNVPSEMRDIVIAPEGKILFCADFDRLEVYVACILSGEKTLLNELLAGIDPHEELRKEIAKHYPAVVRVQAKTVLFGTFYGRSARQIAMTYKVPVATAQEWQDICFRKYPRLKNFFQRVCKEAFEERGYLTTFYGRRRYCERVTQAMNTPIQGTAGEITANALVALEEAGFSPIIQVHDDIVCEEPNTDVERRHRQFVEIIETASRDIFERFPVSGSVGFNWREIKALKEGDGVWIDRAVR